jgi:ribosomal-protein-alanine N-acetyltransferase
MLAQVLQEAAHFAVAELASRIVGYAYSSLTGRHGHISRIAVDPAYQGQGIGIRLLSETIRFFEQNRAFGITLNTQQDNARSRRLYEWFGFKLLGDEAYLFTRPL